MSALKKIDAYLAKLPSNSRQVMIAIRKDVKMRVPAATEHFLYGMPAFKLRSHKLMYYAAWKKHCAIYGLNRAVFERYRKELDGYLTEKGNLHFAVTQAFPFELLERIIRECVREIE